MQYLLIRTDDGRDILQESCRGVVQRYTDSVGNTVNPPFAGSDVVGDASPEWALPDTELEVAPDHDRRITRLAFRTRFTQTEKVALEIAALDNPAASMPERAMAAALRASQADVQASAWIDLSRPDTRAGVQQLEAAGLLGTGRALEILDAPITQDERPINA